MYTHPLETVSIGTFCLAKYGVDKLHVVLCNYAFNCRFDYIYLVGIRRMVL